ncbi:hypothetical protein QNH47_13250 [Virgibacillus halodenitrificans]|uniref:hypothetical protein n=1 Tax=Virgibacillus halodenitrificans TaxID=1482 RepID=UPI0024BF8314|nr:hypothetical protein [Virgibacillus halodenitrificans]WHX25134.1 hypothetical protein QNH47_13250 [Virgibacillus halodenitrificans]
MSNRPLNSPEKQILQEFLEANDPSNKGVLLESYVTEDDSIYFKQFVDSSNVIQGVIFL